MKETENNIMSEKIWCYRVWSGYKKLFIVFVSNKVIMHNCFRTFNIGNGKIHYRTECTNFEIIL